MQCFLQGVCGWDSGRRWRRWRARAATARCSTSIHLTAQISMKHVSTEVAMALAAGGAGGGGARAGIGALWHQHPCDSLNVMRMVCVPAAAGGAGGGGARALQRRAAAPAGARPQQERQGLPLRRAGAPGAAQGLGLKSSFRFGSTQQAVPSRVGKGRSTDRGASVPCKKCLLAFHMPVSIRVWHGR